MAFAIPSLADAPFSWRGRRLLDRAAVPLYALLAVEGLVVASAGASGAFVLDRALFGGMIGDVAAIVALAWAVRWIGFARVAAAIELFALTLLSGLLTASCSLILAATGLPLADAGLRAADLALFGFDRDSAAALVREAGAGRAMLWVYNSVALSLHLLIVLTIALRGNRAAWRMAIALQLASAIGLLIFPWLPAVGAPPYPYAFEAVFAGVRDGTLRTIDAAALTGVITFPSLHAAGGAILAWGFARLGRGAAPLVALNLLVIVSAITTGGHYLVDVVAGLGVAWGAIALSGRLAPPQQSAVQGASPVST